MLSLIFLLLVAIVVVLIISGNRSKDGEGFFIIAFFVGAAALVTFGFLYCTINTVGTGHMVEEKITIYEEENKNIEESITMLVEEYMGYGEYTYNNLKTNDIVQLASLVEDVKSDSVVQYKIKVYLSNNEKIKQLKEQEIELAKEKWKLYFGG